MEVDNVVTSAARRPRNLSSKSFQLPAGLSLNAPQNSSLRGRKIHSPNASSLLKGEDLQLKSTSPATKSQFQANKLYLHSGPDGGLVADLGSADDNEGNNIRSLEETSSRQFGFRRYIVHSIAIDSPGCADLNPSFTITGSTSDMQLMASDGPECTRLSGGKVECTGAGRVLVDVVATDGLFSLMTALSITVDMVAPQDSFSCSGVEAFGQGIGIQVICPDDTFTSDDIVCFPITSYTPTEDVVACVSACRGDCTTDNFFDLQGVVLNPGLCLWEEDDFDPPVEGTAQSTPSPTGPSTSSTPPPSSDAACLDYEIVFTTGLSPEDNVLAVYEDGNIDNAIIFQEDFDPTTPYSATGSDFCLTADKCWEVLLVDSDGDQDGSLSVTADGGTTNVLSEPGIVCEECDPPTTTFWNTHIGACCMEMELKVTTDVSTLLVVSVFEVDDLAEDNVVDNPHYLQDTFTPDSVIEVTDKDIPQCLDIDTCYAMYISKAGSDGLTGTENISFSVNGQVLLSSDAGSNDFTLNESGDSFWLAVFGSCV